MGSVSDSESSALVLGFHRLVLLPGTLLVVCESLPFPTPTSCPEESVNYERVASLDPSGHHPLCRAGIPAIISEDLVIHGSLQTSLKY